MMVSSTEAICKAMTSNEFHTASAPESVKIDIVYQNRYRLFSHKILNGDKMFYR
jgi:hypothetical protein